MAFSKTELDLRINTALSSAGIEKKQLDEKRLTSLQIVELLIVLEKEFQFEIDPVDYDPQVFSSYENLRFFIEKIVTSAP